MIARSESLGQVGGLTPVDRLGIWLSHRQVRRWVPSFKGKTIGDFGCGYHATFAQTVIGDAERVHLFDVAIDPAMSCYPHVSTWPGMLPATLCYAPSNELDVALCLNALEHLDDAAGMLAEIHRVLKPGGRALINVPSWLGKRALEFSAFRLGLGHAQAQEMDDHRAYYDVRDLWPMLVAAGFKPSAIRCFSHKFGLNTFAVCDK